MTPAPPCPVSSDPLPPKIGAADIAHQFWQDIYGKEVQSAATYSYLWTADQVGHIGISLALYQIVRGVAGIVPHWLGVAGLSLAGCQTLALVIVAVAVCLWEFSAYRADVRRAGGAFPLDRGLLARNALIAATYMVIGDVLAWTFDQLFVWAAAGTIVLLVVAVLLAMPWLRQKIIWQKAALPYVFRLADAGFLNINQVLADELQALLDAPAPPDGPPRQIIIAGPAGSGRTSLATGFGTEFAFKGRAVRYIRLAQLLEFAPFYDPATIDFTKCDDAGPANIDYWRWVQSQVLIIDDLGPVLGSTNDPGKSALIAAILADLHVIGPAIGQRHSVWVVGDVGEASQGTNISPELAACAEVIQTFCGGTLPPLVVRLAPAAPAPVRNRMIASRA